MTRRLLLALALVGGCKPLPPRGTVPVEHAAGLPRLVLLPDPTATDLDLSATFAAGSAFDPIGRDGLASLTAHVWVAGGAGPLDPGARRAALDAVGGHLSVLVDRDWATLRLRCPAAAADTCLDLFADAVTAPRFEEVIVAQERVEALDRLGPGQTQDDAQLARDLLDAWLFQAHPYGHPVAGRVGSVSLLTRADLVSFQASHVVRASTVIGLAGPVAGDQVARLMDRLRALPSTLPKELVLMRPLPLDGRSLLVVDTGSEVARLRVGATLDVGRSDPDFPALWVALTALGAEVDGPSGTLRQQGMWSMSVGPTSPADAAFALKAAVRRLERAVGDGLGPQAVEDAKVALLAAHDLDLLDANQRLASAAESVAAGTPDPVRLLAGALGSLTADQVNAALRRHLDPTRLRIVAVGGQGQALADALTATAADVRDAPDAETARMNLGLTSVSVRTATDLFR